MRIPTIAALAALALAGLPAPASAAGSPCGKGSKTLVRNPDWRIVTTRNDSAVYACTTGRALLLTRLDHDEGSCGSNAAVYDNVDREGTALSGGYAAIVVRTIDECGSGRFKLRRFDLRAGRGSTVASGSGEYAVASVLLNAAGTIAYRHSSRVWIAPRGGGRRTLVAGNAGSWDEPEPRAIGAGRLPRVTVTQGGVRTRIDAARQLEALARCRSGSAPLITAALAAGNRVCSLATGRSIAERGCRLARGAAVLCGSRIVDAATGEVLLEHATLAKARDAVPAAGARVVALTGQRIVLLSAAGEQELAAADARREFWELRVDGGTVRWRSTRPDRPVKGAVSRSLELPPPA